MSKTVYTSGGVGQPITVESRPAMTNGQRALLDLMDELTERTMLHLDDVTAFGWIDRIDNAQTLLSDLLSLITNARDCDLIIDRETLAGDMIADAIAAHRESQQHPWDPELIVYH